MAEFEYTTVPAKVPALLSKIREVGVPPKVTVQWLKTIGFTSSNDPSLINVLEQIGFVDGSRVPREPWKKYRGGDYRRVLGEATRNGYKELYETYADARTRSNAELDSFFSTHTTAGKSVRDLTVRTFRTLAGLADFGPAVEPIETPEADASPELPIAARQAIAGATININVQLVLPESADETVYERFFSAMKKHLLTPNGE
jgi:Family of unknown function (DUF5343)